MPELKEVFDMVTKQTEPDIDSWRDQEQRQRRTARNRRVGAFALVAAMVAVAAVIGIIAMRPDNQERTGGPPVTIREDATHVVVDVDTGATTALPAPLDGGYFYAVSPDGDELAFAPLPDPIGDDGQLHIYIGNVDGTDVRRVTLSTGMDEVNPRWTPAGQIVFQGRDRHNEEVGDLYLLDPASGSTTKLTDLPAQSSHHWFMSESVRPDGRVILFNLPRGPLEDQVWDLWTIPATGGVAQLLSRDAAHGSYSPDGTKIAYLGTPRFEGDQFAGTSIWLADADGKDPRLLVMAPGEQEELSWPRWSPDGTRIAYTFESAVYVVDVDTGQVAKVLDGGTPEWLDDHTLIVARA